MATNGDSLGRAPGPSGIEATHGPIVFQVRLFADGHLDWKGPNGPDPIVNEIMFRGYFSKVRDAILSTMARNPSILG